MPAHAVLAVVTLAIATVAAALGIAYALAPQARRPLRWPLLVVSTAAFVLAAVTGELGSSLLDSVKAAGSAAEARAAQDHAHGSDALTVALFALLVVVPSTIWKALSPRKEQWDRGAAIGAVLLVTAAVAVILTGAITLVAALHAVTIGHPAWTAS
jgi:cellobiose-specific phosphotransferase system component IIC